MHDHDDLHSWLGIELRHLAALHAVADERSFVRAAKRLGYTQSAISNQIAAFERLVGARLVERARGASAISLTETGQVLYDHAVALMARLQAARSDAAASSRAAPATLRVGYFQSVGGTLLPRIVRRFRDRWATMGLELELGDAERLLQEEVAAGTLDAAFVAAPLRVASIASTHLLDDPFVLLAPPGATRPPTLDELSLLAYNACPVQQEHETRLRSTHGVRQASIRRLEDAATIQALVAAGCAYALLPSLAVSAPELIVETLDGPSRDIRLVWQRDRTESEPLRDFVAAAEAACRGFAQVERTAA